MLTLPQVNPPTCPHNCGLCCMARGRPPFARGEHIPEELAGEIRQAVLSPRYSHGNPCLWLDMPTGACKHYEHRPQACRDFAPGNSECTETRCGKGLPAINGKSPPATMTPEIESRVKTCLACESYQGHTLNRGQWPVFTVKCKDCGCAALSLVSGRCPAEKWGGVDN